jgi:predicted metal-dependent phosphoesterase TrpH
MRIDLHTHTTASDGTDGPAALVTNAARHGIDVLAITDHDTTAGWEQAANALPPGMTLVRGMEMSCIGHGERGYPVSVHLLAYLFDPEHPVLAQERARLRAERDARIRTMAAKMSADGLPIDVEAIIAESGPAVGRPHLARALVAAGIVDSVPEAFAHLLAANGPYYVRKADTWIDDAVGMIAAAGGVSVIAHARAKTRGSLIALSHIEKLVGLGLGGLEVHHPDHDGGDRALLARLARDHDLIVTGSSDYHGTNKSVGLGDHTTDPAQFERLVARATGAQLLTA